MAPKKKKEIVKVPEGLEDLIKNAASAAFPEKPEVAQKISVCVSKIDTIDCQFIIRPIATRLQLDCSFVIILCHCNSIKDVLSL